MPIWLVCSHWCSGQKNAKNVNKSVKIHQIFVEKLVKKHVFLNCGPHCALGINLSTTLDLASNFKSIDTLGQHFRPKLEVSIPNPPTEIQLCFSFWWSDSEKNDKVSFVKTSGLKLKDSLIQIFFKIWLYPNIYFWFYSLFIRLKFG